MSSFNPGQSAQFGSQRYRTNHKIKFSFHGQEMVHNAYLLNLSETGMFIRCEVPPTHGTELDFELFAARKSRSLHGRAKVVWVRSRKEGHDRPQGMGVAMTSMEPGSQQWLLSSVGEGSSSSRGSSETERLPSIVDDVLAEPLDYGTTPLDSGLVGATVIAASTPASSAAMPSAAAAATAGTYYDSSKVPRGRGFDLLAVAALLLLIGVAGSLYYFRGGGSSGDASSIGVASDGEPSTSLGSDELAANTVSSEAASVETVPFGEEESPPLSLATGTHADPSTPLGEQEPPPESLATNSKPETRITPPATADPVVAEETLAADLALLTPAVEAWAKAWSEQDAEGYLSSYGKGFKPPRNMSRGRWESRRRERIASPQFIRISLSQMQVESLDESRARATFHQEYRSDRMGDTVRKALDMTWEEGRWKISVENVLAKIK
jgi:Tfp pilus assembly protein PilZ